MRDMPGGSKPATECNEVVTSAVSASRSRLTQKKHVMPTGGRNLHRRNRLRLPANVRHIERQRIDNIRSLTAYPQPPVEWRFDSIAPGPRDEVGEVFKIKHLDAAD